MNSQRRARPILGELLDSRALSAGLAGGTALHLAFVGLGWGGWPCPWKQATGIPCPGCGLGRAGVLLLHGDVAESLRMHAFAGPCLAALGLIVAGTILPERWRRGLARRVSEAERRVPILPLFLAALVIYWLARFSLDGGEWLTVKEILY